MFEVKLDTILKVLLLNSSHVKVDPNKHCQIKNHNKLHNKLTTIEGSKFVNVMLQYQQHFECNNSQLAKNHRQHSDQLKISNSYSSLAYTYTTKHYQ
jgi:hypothetical protein